jgi:hypothetical protein
MGWTGPSQTAKATPTENATKLISHQKISSLSSLANSFFEESELDRMVIEHSQELSFI